MKTYNRKDTVLNVSKNPASFKSTDEWLKDAINSGRTATQLFLDSEASRQDGLLHLMDTKVGINKFFEDSVAGFYATNAFEVLDLTPNMPLSKFWYQLLMPIRFGGGLAEGIGAFRMQLTLAKARLAGGNTNEVPVVSAEHQKLFVPTYTTVLGLVLGDIDWLKAKQINYDILGFHVEALRLSYQRELEYFAMIGNEGIVDITSSSEGFYAGLLNQKEANILGILDLEDETILPKNWNVYNVDNFIELLVREFTKIMGANQYDTTKIPNHILIPPNLWQVILKTATIPGTPTGSIASAQSVYEYVKRQLEFRVGHPLIITELPYLDIADISGKTTSQIAAPGTNSTGRMVIYRQDESVLRMHIAMGLTGGQLAWSPTEDAYRQNHKAVTSVPLLLYPTTMYYIDNGETIYYDITFDLNTGNIGGVTTAVVTPIAAGHNILAAAPANVVKTGNVLIGWAYDSAGEDLVGATEVASVDDTVYAVWEAE